MLRLLLFTSSWEIQVKTLIRHLLKVLKSLRRKGCRTSTWLHWNQQTQEPLIKFKKKQYSEYHLVALLNLRFGYILVTFRTDSKQLQNDIRRNDKTFASAQIRTAWNPLSITLLRNYSNSCTVFAALSIFHSPPPSGRKIWKNRKIRRPVYQVVSRSWRIEFWRQEHNHPYHH